MHERDLEGADWTGLLTIALRREDGGASQHFRALHLQCSTFESMIERWELWFLNNVKMILN